MTYKLTKKQITFIQHLITRYHQYYMSKTTNEEFYGVIAELHRPVGPFKAEVAYRYRHNISSDFVTEKRGSIGLAYEVNKQTEIGVTYHNYFKDTSKDTNAVAISMTRKF